MDLQTGHLEDRYHANYLTAIMYYEAFLHVFFESIFPKKKLFVFCVLALENQEVFSESCSLITGVLQDSVKICKKYMEVTNFLLVICSLEKQFLEE